MEGGLKLLFSAEEVNFTVERLADKIRRDYSGKEPLLIGILKGSFVFLSDLTRALKMPIEIDFIRAISYGNRHVSSGDVRITKDIETDIAGRDVILVEDIVDTGLTLNVIVEHLKAKKPDTLKVCALVERHVKRELPVKIDYLGLSAKGGFLVGYGLDYNEKYRYLPGIYALEEI